MMKVHVGALYLKMFMRTTIITILPLRGLGSYSLKFFFCCLPYLTVILRTKITGFGKQYVRYICVRLSDNRTKQPISLVSESYYYFFFLFLVGFFFFCFFFIVYPRKTLGEKHSFVLFAHVRREGTVRPGVYIVTTRCRARACASFHP